MGVGGGVFEYIDYSRRIKMGCESSMLQQNNEGESAMRSLGSLDEQDPFKIDLHKFIERQRGEILTLYHFSRVISRGSAVIRKVMERNSRISRICKIKSVRGQTSFFSCFQEVEVLKHLNHPNIVQIIEYFIQRNYLYILLEDIPGKTLYEMLYNEELTSLKVIISIMKQLLIALKFTHQKGFAHKSIHPQHILVFKVEGQNNYILKLTGFGNAQRLGTVKITPVTQFNESAYLAPQAENSKHIDKLDIWGCGIVLLNLLTGEQTFNDFANNREQIMEESVENTRLSTQKKKTVLDFLRKTLQLDPNKRISAAEALQHPLFEMRHKSETIFREKQADVMQRLLRFRAESTLMSLFSMYGTLNILSVQEKAEHMLQFYNLDKNKDGKIDFQELVECTENTYNIDHSIAVEHVKKIFSQSNKSENCSLEFNEYLSATTFMKKEIFERSLEKIFDEIDIDKDRKISRDELEKALGENHIGEILKEFENRELNFDNFRDFMLKLFEKSNAEPSLL